MTFFFEAFNVENDGLMDKLEYFIAGLSNRHAAGKIGDVGAETVRTLLYNNHVTHRSTYLKPACFRIALSVPDGMSTLGFPATVTRPGLSGCLN